MTSGHGRGDAVLSELARLKPSALQAVILLGFGVLLTAAAVILAAHTTPGAAARFLVTTFSSG